MCSKDINDSIRHWEVNFNTVRPLPRFPRILRVICQSEETESYHFRGEHWRDERHFVFQFTISGAGIFHDDAGDHPVPAGSGFLTQISDPTISYRHPGGKAEPWVFLFADFDGESAEFMARDLIDRHGHVFALGAEHEAVQSLMRFKAYEGADKVYDDGTVDIAATKGAAIVSSLLLTLTVSLENQAITDPDTNLVRRAKSLIQRELANGINVTILAARLDVSRAHFTRVFKVQTGSAPYQYIMRERVKAACQLLHETTINLQDISAQLGYHSSAHFTRSFKQVLRMTPKQFREVGSSPTL